MKQDLVMFRIARAQENHGQVQSLLEEALRRGFLPLCYLDPEQDRGSRAGRSGQVEAVQVHHLGPGCYKVLHELFFRTFPAINFRNGP